MVCRVQLMAAGGSHEVYRASNSMRWLLWTVECNRWHEVAPMELRVQQRA
jgi:hypothetical protein